MATYLVATDGMPASETLCAHLETELVDGDQLVVINVLEGDNLDDIEQGQVALDLFEERLGGTATVRTQQLNRGVPPSEEIVATADEVDADRIVVALRRHTRTERVIFGSVSHALLQRVSRPITLVPLAEYQAPDS